VPALAKAGIPALAKFDMLARYAVAAPKNLADTRAQPLTAACARYCNKLASAKNSPPLAWSLTQHLHVRRDNFSPPK
jgi:hypothetical protein